MPTTYSTNLALSLIATGEEAGNWGTITNTNLGTLLEQAISGYVTQAITDGADTVIQIQNGVTSVARNMAIQMTGSLSAARNLIVPANRKLYFIHNNTSGGYAVTVKVSGQTGVSVPNGRKMVLVSNGTDVVQAVDYTTVSYAGSFIPLGSSVPANGVYLPSANTVGVAANTTNVMNLTSGGIQVGSPTGGYKGVGTINATGLFVNGNAVGVGTGTVTSVAGTGSVNGITLSGTGSGDVTLTLGGTLSGVNLGSQVTGTLAIGSGGTGKTTASEAINALVPSQTDNGGKYLTTNGSAVSWATVAGGTGTVTSITLSTGTTGLTVSGGSSQTITTNGTFAIDGNLEVANGGTGATAKTGSGSNVLNNGPTLIAPVLGTPASGTLTNCTIPLGGVTGLGLGVATFLGTPSSANLAAAVTGETGTGALVFSTNPILVTPNIGTPTAGTLTSCTGLPISTGVSGLAAGIATFLTTPTSANLKSAVTDETGSGGSLVFSQSPTFTGTAAFAAVQTSGVIDVGNASDTTLSRLSAAKLGVEGKALIKHTGSYTSGEVTLATTDPTGGSDGDIWLKYTA